MKTRESSTRKEESLWKIDKNVDEEIVEEENPAIFVKTGFFCEKLDNLVEN